ncbi:MAG TPA: hypothetical protein VII74_02185 [Chthoniobacterales bacterium]
MPTTHRVLLILAVGLLVRVPARGDITLPGASPPPQADGEAARVPRGGEASIELQGHSGGSGQIRFLIVRQPLHGQLSDLQSLGDNRARITYKHDADEREAEDGFSYVVEGDGRISLPAEVRIQVEEPPARLFAPKELDFGETIAGTSVARSLSLANEGGGKLEGSLTISSPWHLASSAYNLPSGKNETIAVTFQPTEEKDFVGQVTLTGSNGDIQTVSLHGTATAPLRIAPNPLNLLGQRRATVFLTNLTNQMMILNFRTSSHFRSIPSLEVAPKEDSDIPVEVSPEMQRPFHETITVVGVHFTMPLRVEFTPPPPPPAEHLQPSAPTAVAQFSPPSTSEPSATPAASGTPATNFDEPVTARRLGASRWELRWPAKQAAAHYRIEERQLALDGNNELKISWRELPASKIARTKNQAVAQLDRMKPSDLHMLRVVALAADGSVLWESPLVTLRPLPVRSHARAFWLFCLFAGLSALVYLRWRAQHSFA